jgi:DNA-binding MarR family transcriptional regulator
MTDDKPRSAVELAMERLRQKDADSGVSEASLTDKQKAAIAEVRNIQAAKAAELEILHKAKLVSTFDPEAHEVLRAEHARDIQRLSEESERKVRKIRESGD